jgi:hypothetical protein
MRIISLICSLFFLNGISNAQEVSLHLPVTQGYSDLAFQCLPLDDGFILLTACNEPDSSGTLELCFGLLRLDASLNPVWSETYHGSPDVVGLPYGATVMEVIGDTVYVAPLAIKPGGFEIHMMAMSLANGALLYQKDILPQGPISNLTCEDMLSEDGDLIIYGQQGSGSTGDACLYFIRLDKEFNELDQNHICDNNYRKRGFNLKVHEQGGYVLVYGEEYWPGTCSLKVARLDEQFNVVNSKELPQTEIDDVFYSSAILATNDGGYFLYWQKDLNDSIPTVYPHTTWPWQPVVYKLDSFFNIEWEYFFVREYETSAPNAKLDSEGNLLVAGASAYFYTHDYFTDPIHLSDGWVFLMKPNGELLWERSIADSVFQNYGGKFWDMVETDEGYLFVGDINLVNPTGVPFLNDPDVWLLTLDKDGCWNGNCNQYIVITGDTTSTTDTKETKIAKEEIIAYPNPTSGVLNISCEGCGTNARRKIDVFDSEGRKVMEVNLFAPKSTINLSRLGNGVYFVVHSVDGEVVGTHKVIVNH